MSRGSSLFVLGDEPFPRKKKTPDRTLYVILLRVMVFKKNLGKNKRQNKGDLQLSYLQFAVLAIASG